jgi:hypothetical protein
MYLVAHHQILSPAAFTRGVRLMIGEGAPEGTRALQFYPSVDGSRVTCLWEGRTVAAVQRYCDDTLGETSTTVLYEVDAENAFARQPLGIAEVSPLVTSTT